MAATHPHPRDPPTLTSAPPQGCQPCCPCGTTGQVWAACWPALPWIRGSGCAPHMAATHPHPRDPPTLTSAPPQGCQPCCPCPWYPPGHPKPIPRCGGCEVGWGMGQSDWGWQCCGGGEAAGQGGGLLVKNEFGYWRPGRIFRISRRACCSTDRQPAAGGPRSSRGEVKQPSRQLPAAAALQSLPSDR